MYKHILVPTDGSPLSARAAKHAVNLAAATGARVTALFVSPSPVPLVFKGLLPVRHLQPEAHRELIARAAARYLGTVEGAAKKAGVACECITVTGEYPADVILQEAARRKCDLIVMASHGRRGLQGVLLGSETQRVLAHARTPVLVYR